MPYTSQAQLSVDEDFLARVSACAAVEIPIIYDPVLWTNTYIWRVAASPGFAESYEYALNTSVPNPGKDPAVITDAQILATVQHIYTLLNPPPAEPEEGP